MGIFFGINTPTGQICLIAFRLPRGSLRRFQVAIEKLLTGVQRNPVSGVIARSCARRSGRLKHLLRKAAERTPEATWKRIGNLLDEFPPDECAAYLVN